MDGKNTKEALKEHTCSNGTDVLESGASAASSPLRTAQKTKLPSGVRAREPTTIPTEVAAWRTLKTATSDVYVWGARGSIDADAPQ